MLLVLLVGVLVVPVRPLLCCTTVIEWRADHCLIPVVVHIPDIGHGVLSYPVLLTHLRCPHCSTTETGRMPCHNPAGQRQQHHHCCHTHSRDTFVGRTE